MCLLTSTNIATRPRQASGGWLAEIESKALRGQQPLLEPELLAIPAQSLVGVQKGSGRDLRIDVAVASRYSASFLTMFPTTSEAG